MPGLSLPGLESSIAVFQLPVPGVGAASLLVTEDSDPARATYVVSSHQADYTADARATRHRVLTVLTSPRYPALYVLY